MGRLNDLFISILLERLSFSIVASKLIRKKLEQQGIKLTKNQEEQLIDALKKVSGDRLTFYLNSETDENIDLTISSEEIDAFFDNLNKKIENMMPELIIQVSKELYPKIISKKNIQEFNRQNRFFQKNFSKDINKYWGAPLELLNFYISLSREAGANFNNQYQDEAYKKQDHVFEAIRKLHARACQTACEIYCLLSSGFADGAMARWRSLHEIAVFGFFIKKHGEDAARRFLDYHFIEKYKSAKSYQKYYKRLKLDSLDFKEMEILKKTCELLGKKHGKDFSGIYGWARPFINKEKIWFSTIEEDVELDHWRPFYELACDSVHITIKGLYFRLGLLNIQEKYKNILLSGPSITGLCDPAQNTVISLQQITEEFLNIQLNIDRAVSINVLFLVMEKIQKQFFDAFIKSGNIKTKPGLLL